MDITNTTDDSKNANQEHDTHAQHSHTAFHQEHQLHPKFPLRRGKWSPEEEAFALAAIRDFNTGYLDAPPGTTLRTYLSEKLQCDPMRITKKFTGDASIGKKVFHPAVRDDPNVLKEIEYSQAKLDRLYQEWKNRLESQEQDMARKSMAAAAVSVASSLCDNPNFHFASSSRGGGNSMRVPLELTNTNHSNILNAEVTNDITKTATWLDRAGTLLSKKTESIQSQTEKEIEEEMEQISHLIEESPKILTISAELPKLLNSNVQSRTPVLQTPMHKLHSCPDLRILCTANPDSKEQDADQSVSTPTYGKRKRSLSDEYITDSPNNPMKLLASLSSQAAPVPIDVNDSKHATDGLTNNSPNNSQVDAEDAKTFVKFLQSVKVNRQDT